MIGLLSELFRDGWSVEDAMILLNFDASVEDLRGEVKRHGFRITRVLTKSDLVRTWGRRKRKLTETELAEVDRWFSMDHYDMTQVRRLTSVHMGIPLGTNKEFEELLLRSGYTWQYAIADRR